MAQPRTTGYEELEQFEARVSDDTVKTDLELTCTTCGQVICDIENEDTLGTLARAATSHLCSDEKDFEDIAAEQGWNDASVASVLMDFIDNHADKSRLIQYAQERANAENEPPDIGAALNQRMQDLGDAIKEQKR